MRHIVYTIDVGYCGCGDDGIATVTDDMSNADIDNMVNDMAHEHANQWEGDYRLAWDEDMSEEEYEEATDMFYENVCGSWSWATAEDLENYGWNSVDENGPSGW